MYTLSTYCMLLLTCGREQFMFINGKSVKSNHNTWVVKLDKLLSFKNCFLILFHKLNWHVCVCTCVYVCVCLGLNLAIYTHYVGIDTCCWAFWWCGRFRVSKTGKSVNRPRWVDKFFKNSNSYYFGNIYLYKEILLLIMRNPFIKRVVQIF